ncbi:head GIN domain-containing protein [Flavobacterium lacus]|uniref:Putative autotransporter adhesin-like protein n=1 Tax=Flavobacterium lacus TaxID=1353778 RepID=A0A328WZ13_9FLAO|nr:head GIN domain-containing protein [Flavobacterium lacus]RAR49697.1 putative autotransporter adhesin-like protein [Flavobacterium lacus]
MKNIFILFLIATSPLFAQTVTKNPGDFTTVKVFDRISAQLIPSNESKVEIKGSRASEVEVVNSNGDLKIRMPFPKLLKGEEIEVTVYYKRLEGVEASEGSYVNSEKPIKAVGFTVNVKEGAEIKIVLDVQKANIKAASGGILKITGSTQNQDIVMTSGAVLKAKDFQSQQTTITLNAGGEADIFATDYVNAKVRAGGDIYIYGSPKQIDQKTVVGGSIKEMN